MLYTFSCVSSWQIQPPNRPFTFLSQSSLLKNLPTTPSRSSNNFHLWNSSIAPRLRGESFRNRPPCLKEIRISKLLQLPIPILILRSNIIDHLLKLRPRCHTLHYICNLLLPFYILPSSSPQLNSSPCIMYPCKVCHCPVSTSPTPRRSLSSL